MPVFQASHFDELKFLQKPSSSGRLTAVKAKHGPDAIGFVTSPRCSNEEAYLLQKLARTVVGTNNVVHGLGLHRQTSIHVLREMLGVPAATGSISCAS